MNSSCVCVEAISIVNECCGSCYNNANYLWISFSLEDVRKSDDDKILRALTNIHGNLQKKRIISYEILDELKWDDDTIIDFH